MKLGYLESSQEPFPDNLQFGTQEGCPLQWLGWLELPMRMFRDFTSLMELYTQVVSADFSKVR